MNHSDKNQFSGGDSSTWQAPCFLKVEVQKSIQHSVFTHILFWIWESVDHSETIQSLTVFWQLISECTTTDVGLQIEIKNIWIPIGSIFEFSPDFTQMLIVSSDKLILSVIPKQQKWKCDILTSATCTARLHVRMSTCTGTGKNV